MNSKDAKSINLCAYAKINLTLEIYPPRGDGYHGVASVMHKISLHDDVSVTLIPQNEIIIDCSVNLCKPEDNLAYKAAKAFMELYGMSFGCKIGIVKHIPDKAGLAGGSADAAAVINALDKLTADGRAGKESRLMLMHKAAAMVGSDVPFCLEEYTCARADGRGEILKKLPSISEMHILVAVPGEGLSTGKIYSSYDNDGTYPLHNAESPLCATSLLENKLFGAKEIDGYKVTQSDIFNSFEPMCTRLLPDIGRVSEALLATGADAVSMSGSGSAVYALYAEKDTAVKAYEIIKGLDFVRFSHLGTTL